MLENSSCDVSFNVYTSFSFRCLPEVLFLGVDVEFFIFTIDSALFGVGDGGFRGVLTFKSVVVSFCCCCSYSSGGLSSFSSGV